MTTTEASSHSESLTPEQLAASIAEYKGFRDQNDQAIRIGIFGEDLDRALEYPDTITLGYLDDKRGKIAVPALVPLEILKWYNIDLLKRTYGEDVKAYYYAHPPIKGQEEFDKVAKMLQQKLAEGCVIVTDKYQDDKDSPVAQLLDGVVGSGYAVEAFSGNSEGGRSDVFVGVVRPNVSDGVKDNAPSLRDVYLSAIESGEIEESPTDGIALAQVITGREAERIWEIYKDPFDELGKDDLSQAGFSKEALLGILADPNIEKFIYRVNGEIVSLSLFFQNFGDCPWFNADYYRKNYPEYFDTNNIFILPGIVTDNSIKGGSYSLKLVDFGARMLARRNTDFLITFECTEVSGTYIPRIVKSAIEKSKVATVTGLAEPVSSVLYRAISQAT